MSLVQFHDRATLKTAVIDERTGYLKANATFSRVGIQEYYGYELGLQDKRANDILRVYRSPEEVGKSADLLKSIPTTDDHPTEDVTSSNWRRLATGWTGEQVTFDQKETSGALVLTDHGAIQKWKNGKKELSVGYACEVVFDAGTTPEGETYHARQINITPNHVAQVDSGRCGPACAIKDHSVTDCRTRSDDGSCNCHEEQDMSQAAAPTLVSRTVDGITFQVNDQAAQFIDKLIADKAKLETNLQTSATALATAQDEHKKAIEAKDGEIAGLKTQIPDAARLEQLATERAAVLAKVKNIMGSTYDASGKTNLQMITDAVTKKLGADGVKDKSEDFINGVFATMAAADNNDGSQNQLQRVIGDGFTGGDQQQRQPRTEGVKVGDKVLRGRDAYTHRLQNPPQQGAR
jgi:uncharacterized protein